MNAEIQPIRLFYSYAHEHEDENLRNTLEKHLSLLKRQGVIQDWHDRCIGAGREWAKEIDANLEAAELILLLISVDFIASDYCHDIELQRAMQRHKAGAARVIPVILRPVDNWQSAPFGQLACLPVDGKAVTTWSNPDEAFADITRGIRQAAKELRAAALPSNSAASSSKAQPAKWRVTYLMLMAAEWRTVRLAALDSTSADPRTRRPLTLDQIYVSLDTTRDRSAVGALGQVSDGCMVLLGQPGSGKSTFARHLALVMAQALLGATKLKAQLPGWPGRRALLPVFISLGRLAGTLTPKTIGAAKVVEDFIRQQMNERPDLAGCGDSLIKRLQRIGGLVIFDGLDEVPSQYRLTVRETISRFTALYRRCKTLVTCRTFSYVHDQSWHLEGWPVEELTPLNPNKIETFIDAWYNALSAGDPNVSYSNKVETLKAALAPGDQRGLSELAGNPLMLTVMAIVHTQRSLPGSRVEVYRECVDILMLRWHTERTPGARPQTLTEDLAALGISDSKLSRGLLELAYEAHRANERERLGKGRALVSERTLHAVMEDYLGAEGLRVFMAYCQHANGLLLADGNVQPRDAPREQAVYAFPHLSFQEYLAALYLRTLRLEVAADCAGDPAWREVIRFLGESFCFGREVNIGLAQALLEELCPEIAPENHADWRRIVLAGELLPIIRREATRRQQRPSLEQRIAWRLVDLLQNPNALTGTLLDRLAANRLLLTVGDPRPGVGLRPDGLPDLCWVRIPGTAEVQASGRFPNFTGLRLGNGAKSDPNARNDETWPADAGPLAIDTFELAMYPVTVAQFRPFVEQGYREDCWWSAGKHSRYDRTQPYRWDDPAWTLDNHPIMGVTWYEAEAYCKWVNKQLCLAPGTIRLPTEAEWEWAARGPEGRCYPWGDQWESWRCNSGELRIKGTIAVGCFPGSAADWWRVIEPAGTVVHDLAGNVWEWTASEYTKNYSGAHRSVLNADAGAPWVVRGGAWLSEQMWLRGAARGWGPVRATYLDGGFRLARTLSL